MKKVAAGLLLGGEALQSYTAKYQVGGIGNLIATHCQGHTHLLKKEYEVDLCTSLGSKTYPTAEGVTDDISRVFTLNYYEEPKLECSGHEKV